MIENQYQYNLRKQKQQKRANRKYSTKNFDEKSVATNIQQSSETILRSPTKSIRYVQNLSISSVAQNKSQRQKLNKFKKQSNPENLITTLTNIPFLKTFLHSNLPKGVKLQATIKVDKIGWTHKNPQYDMYLSNGFQYMMSASKVQSKFKSTYIISTSKNIFSESAKQYLGKLQSNFFGTKYNIFDSDKKNSNIGRVFYEYKCCGCTSTRKMKVLTQNMDSDHLRQESQNPGTMQIFVISNELVSKEPTWDPISKEYVMKFNKRVNKTSVKNFILKYPDSQQDILLFGKVNKEFYNLDAIYPLSPIQAFAISLTSLDQKFLIQ